MNNQLANAILGKVAFKGPDMRRYSAAAIYTAIARFPLPFAADDVPAALRPADNTSAGCAFASLKCERVRVFDRVGRRASKAASRNSAWINEYRVNVNVALRWLKANGFEVPKAERDVLAGQQTLALN